MIILFAEPEVEYYFFVKIIASVFYCLYQNINEIYKTSKSKFEPWVPEATVWSWKCTGAFLTRVANIESVGFRSRFQYFIGCPGNVPRALRPEKGMATETSAPLSWTPRHPDSRLISMLLSLAMQGNSRL